LFAGSERGAAMCGQIVTAKLNEVDPQAWLDDVLARIAQHLANRVDQLLPWSCRPLHPASPAHSLEPAS
jgi:transposase